MNFSADLYIRRLKIQSTKHVLRKLADNFKMPHLTTIIAAVEK